MSNKTPSKRSYPWTTEVGGKSITFRMMERKDKPDVLALIQTLPEEDLLFLTFDITNPLSLDNWFDNIEASRAKTVLAESDGKIVGMANLTYNQLHWTRHLADIWLLVNNNSRGRGLGQLLANEVFALAQELGLQKLVAQMAAEQRGALQVFEHFGFKAEALLADHVIDNKNRTHDLVLMSYDVTSFTE